MFWFCSVIFMTTNNEKAKDMFLDYQKKLNINGKPRNRPHTGTKKKVKNMKGLFKV